MTPQDLPPRDDLRIPRKSFFQLLPRRSLAHVVLMLAILFGIIVLRRRSGTIVKNLSESLMPLFPPAPPGAPLRSPPTVRLGPVVPPAGTSPR